MLCEACGREEQEKNIIDLYWSATGCGEIVERTYRVCGNCNNGFMVVVSDRWARMIASRIEMRDKGTYFPPLICNKTYYEGYKNKPFSQTIREEIDTLLNNLEQRIRLEIKYLEEKK